MDQYGLPNNVGQTLLKGHALRGEGRPFSNPTCVQEACEKHRRRNPDDDRASAMLDRSGHALCECGDKSEHLESHGARKTWHKAHKEAKR